MQYSPSNRGRLYYVKCSTTPPLHSRARIALIVSGVVQQHPPIMSAPHPTAASANASSLCGGAGLPSCPTHPSLTHLRGRHETGCRRDATTRAVARAARNR